MDDHRIKVKNFVVAELCFRKLGEFVNFGSVIVDKDSYNFAGMITDDKVIGYYKNGKYNIHYYKSLFDIQKDPITYQYMYRYDQFNKHINYTIGFLRTEDIKEDFTEVNITQNPEGYGIEFIKICEDIKEANRVFNYNYNKRIIDVL